eukprot:12754926-Alexandrium_andersonii.AAC.1
MLFVARLREGALAVMYLWHGCTRARWSSCVLVLAARGRARCTLRMHKVARRMLRLHVRTHAALG